MGCLGHLLPKPVDLESGRQREEVSCSGWLQKVPLETLQKFGNLFEDLWR